MSRCPSCARHHAERDTLAIADTLREALAVDKIGELRAVARKATLELQGYCGPCTFRMCAGLERLPAPRSRRLMIVRPLDEQIEREYLDGRDGFQSAEIGRRR